MLEEWKERRDFLLCTWKSKDILGASPYTDANNIAMKPKLFLLGLMVMELEMKYEKLILYMVIVTRFLYA